MNSIGPDEIAAIIREETESDMAKLREILPYPRFPISIGNGEDWSLYLHEAKHNMLVWVLVAWDGIGADLGEHEAWCRITDIAVHELKRPLRGPEMRLITACNRDAWLMKQALRRQQDRREATETADLLHRPGRMFS